MRSREAIDALRAALEAKGRTPPDADDELYDLLDAADLFATLGVDAPIVDEDRVWARVEASMPVRTTSRRRRPLHAAASLARRAVRSLMRPLTPMARVLAVALLALIVLTTILARGSGEPAPAELLRDVAAIATVSAAAAEEGTISDERLREIEQRAERLVSFTAARPDLLPQLSTEHLAHARAQLEGARASLAVLAPPASARSRRLEARLDGMIAYFSQELAQRGEPSPRRPQGAASPLRATSGAAPDALDALRSGAGASA